MTFFQTISDMALNGLFLHASYVFLIFFLLFDKRKQYLVLDKALHKNIILGDKLDIMRVEMTTLHNDLIRLTKENHSLHHELQLLTHQVNALREEVKKKKD